METDACCIRNIHEIRKPAVQNVRLGRREKDLTMDEKETSSFVLTLR